MEIQSYINNEDKDKKFNSIVKSVGIMQLAMYSREALKKVKEQSEGKKEEQKDRIELGIMYQALNRIKFFDKSIKFHNQKYKIFVYHFVFLNRCLLMLLYLYLSNLHYHLFQIFCIFDCEILYFYQRILFCLMLGT